MEGDTTFGVLITISVGGVLVIIIMFGWFLGQRDWKDRYYHLKNDCPKGVETIEYPDDKDLVLTCIK